jgi:hypothetical protein
MTSAKRDLDSTSPAASEKPIRVGVFNSILTADDAVAALLAAGFRDDEITVFCSGERLQEHFRGHQPPVEPGPALYSALAGSAVGSALGGLGAAVILGTTGGIPVLVIGAMAAMWTGGVAGGLAGAMMTRGFEKESADFFEQAVGDGKIVVAVECAEEPNISRLHDAEQALRASGAEPLPLREG